MSARTRINRPTTSTSRKLKNERLIFQASDLRTVKTKDGLVRQVALKGRTYVREK